MGTLSGPVASAALKTTVVLGFRLALQTAGLILVARALGPSLYGAFAAISGLAFMFGTLSTFGTHLLVIAATSRRGAASASELSIAPPITLLCGAGLLIAYLATGLAWSSAASTTMWVFVLLGIAEIIAQPLLQLVSSELQGRGEIVRSQLLFLSPLVIRTGAAVIIAVFPTSDPMLFYAFLYAMGATTAVVLTVSALAKWILDTKKWKWPTRSQLKTSAGYAAINLTALGPAEIDKIIVFKLLPAPEAGLYTAASRVLGAVISPVIALLISAAPRLFRDGHSPDQGDYRRFERTIFVVVLLYGLVLAVALQFGAFVFDHLFGSRYQGVGDVVKMLAYLAPILALRIAAGNVLMTRGQLRARLWSEATGLIVLVAVSSVCAPLFQIRGIIGAVASSEFTMLVIGFIALRRLGHQLKSEHRVQGG